MGLKCKIFGCGHKESNFDFYGNNKKRCKKCGKEYVYINFYPNKGPSWLDLKFVNTWGIYENMISTPRYCEVCGRYEDIRKEFFCPCGSC